MSDYSHEYERAKYNTVWAHEDYHKHSPAVAALGRIRQRLQLGTLAGLDRPLHILDAGCGSARAAYALAIACPGTYIHAVDISIAAAIGHVPMRVAGEATNAAVVLYEQPLDTLPYAEGKERHVVACDSGYCIDVMEHIPPSLVEKTLLALSFTVSGKMYFEIAGYKDHFGPALIGEPLHLTVMSMNEWHCHLFRYWERVDGTALSGSTWAFLCEQPRR